MNDPEVTIEMAKAGAWIIESYWESADPEQLAGHVFVEMLRVQRERLELNRGDSAG